MKGRVLFVACSLALVATLGAFASGTVEMAGKGVYRLVGLFSQTVTLVRSNYVEEVPVEKLQVGAIAGLVESADPGGEWVPDASIAGVAQLRDQTLPAWGLVLGRRASYPFVLQVVPGSPAEKAGIQAGELLEYVAGQSVRAQPLWWARLMLADADRAGRELAVEVIDRQFDGKRRVVLQPGSRGATMPAALDDRNGVPVLRIGSVDAKAVQRVQELLGSSPATSVVVDLRKLGLGDAESAAPLAAALTGGDVSITLVGRDGEAKGLKASGPPRSWRVIALVDPTTAGPAELVALALKDRGATLLGGESYGDTGQRRSVLAAGGELWLAERWAIGPDSKPLLGNGLKPDEQVRPRKDGDPTLERALEIARGAALRKAA